MTNTETCSVMNDDDETSHGTYLPWDDGLPTRPDVDALIKAFPPETLAPGTRISDEQFLEVVPAKGQRFKTVYAAWMRRLANDHRVLLKRAKKVGFFVPTAAEALADTHPTLEHIGRSARKQLRALTIIKPAEGAESLTRDHHSRLLGHIRHEARKARTNILPPTAASQMPTIPAPKGRST